MLLKVDYTQRNATQAAHLSRRSARGIRRHEHRFDSLEDRVVPAASWLDSYAGWFNDTFGGGYSQTVGGWIYNNAPVSDSTLANASDTVLAGGVVAVAVPTGIALVAGGELVLGVGTVGGTTTTTAGAAGGGLTAGQTTIVTTYQEIQQSQTAISQAQGLLSSAQTALTNLLTSSEVGVAETLAADDAIMAARIAATEEGIAALQATIATETASVEAGWTLIDLLLPGL